MPNDLTAVVPRILAKALMVIREETPLMRLVRTDFKQEAMEKGKSVDVPYSSAMGLATDVVPSLTYNGGVDITPKFVPIMLDKWVEQKFTLNDREVDQVMDGYFPDQIIECARSVANRIEIDLLNLYKVVYGAVGTPGQIPFQDPTGLAGVPPVHFGIGASREARRILNSQLCPDEDRRIILDVNAEANASAIPQFAQAYASGDKDVITKGLIGEKQGFTWYRDNLILRHVTGLTGTVLVSTAAAINTTTLIISGAATPPAIGDIFTLAGNSQQYVVLPTSTIGVLQVSPPLKVAVPAGTLVSVIPSHTVNLAIQKGAFGLVMRPLSNVEAPGSLIRTMTDNKTGLPLRMEVSRVQKMNVYSIDALYGCACLRPEYACRIMG
jgi:P22 coat protein - gene protein 5